MLNSFVRLETKTSEPILVGTTRVLLTSQALRITWPGRDHGGLIWNRPVSVTTRAAEGEELTTPVIDVTRVAQLSILAGMIAVALVASLISRRRV